jgi:hypothetical protein
VPSGSELVKQKGGLKQFAQCVVMERPLMAAGSTFEQTVSINGR